MFWKRKPKKQDGQEATDSAAEAAAEREETAPASGEEPAKAEKDSPRADEAEPKADGTEDGDRAGEAEDAAARDGAEDAEKGEDAKDPGESDESGEPAETEASDDSEENEEKKQEAAEDDSPADIFADEGEEAGVTGPDTEKITRVRAVGVLDFEGEKYDVVSNTWIIEADDEGVVVIDPGGDAEAIMEAVGKREVYLVACTNAYNPHIESAIKVAEESEAPIALHPREMRAWRRHHGAEHRPDIEVEGQGALDIGDLHIDVVALPGTSTGTVGYYVSELGVIFSGDILHKGGPGMVGNVYIDYTTQLNSIGDGLLSLPPDTRVLPDRGPATTVAAESKNFDSWITRD